MKFENHPCLGNKHIRDNFAFPRAVEEKKVSSS